MNVTYILCKETYKTKQAERTAYGIAAYAQDSNTCIAHLHDVSPDKASISALVSLCNHLQLSPVHLDDVVEDFLAF